MASALLVQVAFAVSTAGLGVLVVVLATAGIQDAGSARLAWWTVVQLQVRARRDKSTCSWTLAASARRASRLAQAGHGVRGRKVLPSNWSIVSRLTEDKCQDAWTSRRCCRQQRAQCRPRSAGLQAGNSAFGAALGRTAHHHGANQAPEVHITEKVPTTLACRLITGFQRHSACGMPAPYVPTTSLMA